jgi:hypothetical protein
MVVVERLPLLFALSVSEPAKPSELLVEISHPAGADSVTVSLLASPLPATVNVASVLTVPTLVAGNVNDDVSTLSVGPAVALTVPLTSTDLSVLLYAASSTVRYPVTLAAAEALMRA